MDTSQCQSCLAATGRFSAFSKVISTSAFEPTRISVATNFALTFAGWAAASAACCWICALYSLGSFWALAQLVALDAVRIADNTPKQPVFLHAKLLGMCLHLTAMISEASRLHVGFYSVQHLSTANSNFLIVYIKQRRELRRTL